MTSMNGGAVNFDHAVDIYGSATKSGVYGIYTTGTGSSIHAKDKVVIETVGGTTNRGIQVSGGGNALFENSLIVKTSGDSGSNYGIFVSSGGTLKADGDLQLAVSGAYAQAGLLVDGANSVVQINGRADIDFVTDSASFAVNAWNQGKIDFNGAVFINANSIREEHLNKAVIAVMENGTVNINQSGGKQVVIKGGISASNGNLNLTLDRSDSVLEGYILSNGSSNTALKLSNASAWRLSNMLPSRVGKVELSSDATIDMTFGGMSATELSIGDYSGTGGNFILYTDLASEADGDKVVITNAAAGTTYVQVKDASLTNGSVVTGNKNLLLITDASKNAAFVGKKLNAGGLWDVTPTIENGLKVTLNDGTQGTEEQWYLTKIAKAVNNDTGVLLNAATIAMPCGVTVTIRCVNAWANCAIEPIRTMAMAFGPVIQAANLAAAVLTAATICISWAMTRRIMLKAPMALPWKVAPAMLTTASAAARISCGPAACMVLGRAGRAIIPMWSHE